MRVQQTGRSSCVVAGAPAPRVGVALLGVRQPSVASCQATRRTGYQDLAPAPGLDSLDFDFMDTTPGLGGFTYPNQQGYGYPNQQGGYQGLSNANSGRYVTQQPLRQLQQQQPQVDWRAEAELLGDNDQFLAGDLPVPEEDRVPPQQRTVNGKQLLINTEIKASHVRVISGEGGKQQRGVMSFMDAMLLARDLQVDLVLLNDQVNPPLCRLVAWSKYKYEVEKDQKKKASKSANVETKEVRLRPGTDSNDLNTKLKSAIKFLEKGNKVKLSMKFEGRQLQFKEQGKQVMLKFVEDLATVGKVDGAINFKTGTYTAMLSPTGRMMGAPAPAEQPKQDTPAPAAVTAQLPLPPAPAVPQPAGVQLPLPPSLPPAGQQLPLPPAPAALPPRAPPAAPVPVPAAAPVARPVPPPAPVPQQPLRPVGPPAGVPLPPPPPGGRPFVPQVPRPGAPAAAPPLQRPPGIMPPPKIQPGMPVPPMRPAPGMPQLQPAQQPVGGAPLNRPSTAPARPAMQPPARVPVTAAP